MAKFKIVMPKMGESVIEATITKWMVNEGDSVEEDDSLAEIATDKVDSEIPSPVEGTVSKLLFEEGDTVAVGEIIAVIDVEGDDEEEATEEPTDKKADASPEEAEDVLTASDIEEYSNKDFETLEGFYSPLVRSIAKEENISLSELESIKGRGKDGRVTKEDILEYRDNRGKSKTEAPAKPIVEKPTAKKTAVKTVEAPKVQAGGSDTVVEMDRMRKMIADHMVMSKQVSPHVTMFIEVDMTNVVNWRNSVKNSFQKREREKITFTPIFIEATAQALKEFPRVNASVDGYNIIERKRVNVGMATALPDGNLIVPVIKDADQKNLLGLTKNVNDLATRARASQLDPDEIGGGTFTLTNFGSFNNLTGSPIINQPQVAILGVGAIQKKPAVLETEHGDVIAIRHMMVLSMAFDHRIVDGSMGGQFLNRMKELLENFDTNQTV